MQQRDLAEVVLYQLEIFTLLQELDEGWRNKDDCATQALNQFLIRRRATLRLEDVMPLVRRKSVISLFALPFALAYSQQDLLDAELGFSIDPRYGITYTTEKHGSKPTASEPNVKSVIRTIRNAVSHLPDFSHGNSSPSITFNGPSTTFRSQDPRKEKSPIYEVTFGSEAGFVSFLGDVALVVRRIARKLIQEQATSTDPRSLLKIG